MTLPAAAPRKTCLALVLTLVVVATAHAVEIPADLSITAQVLIPLLGGLALLLYGLEQVSAALKAAGCLG